MLLLLLLLFMMLLSLLLFMLLLLLLFLFNVHAVVFCCTALPVGCVVNATFTNCTQRCGAIAQPKEMACRYIRQGCIISLAACCPTKRDAMPVDQTGLHHLVGAERLRELRKVGC